MRSEYTVSSLLLSSPLSDGGVPVTFTTGDLNTSRTVRIATHSQTETSLLSSKLRIGKGITRVTIRITAVEVYINIFRDKITGSKKETFYPATWSMTDSLTL